MKTCDRDRGIETEVERSFLVLWVLTVLISSLVGDNIILIATCRIKVLNLHKVMVALIQHMAICDLLQSIFRVFPSTTALIADKWILAEALGHVQDNSIVSTTFYSISLTCALTSVKYLHLKYPLVARTWSSKTGHIISLVLLGFVLGVYAPIFVVKISYVKETLCFNYVNYECSYQDRLTKLPVWYKFYSSITFSLFLFLCNTLLVINSVLILLKAKKVRSRTGGGVRLRGTVTVLLTVAVQFISYLPLCVTFAFWVITGVDYSGKLWRAVTYAVYLNTMANFCIYYFTSRSFREFLKIRVNLFRESIQNKVYPGHS